MEGIVEKPFLDCQWDGKEGKEEGIMQKEAKRKGDQFLDDKEENKKKKIRKLAKKRSRSKKRCEVSDRRELEIRRKLKSGVG